MPRRLADTTMRELLCKLDPLAVRPVLHRLVQAANRRRALTPEHLPFGVIAMDGKVTALPDGRSPYAQRQTHDNGVPYWLMRTVTSCLVSGSSRAMRRCAARPQPRRGFHHRRAQRHEVRRAHRPVDVGAPARTLTAVFAEDGEPMTPGNASAALVVMLLRRIAYTLLALFRAVTLRPQDVRVCA